MKHLLIFKILLLLACSVFGQSNEPVDYDARLALARRYFLSEEYQQAISIYMGIYAEDSTDVEAMNGMGACYGAMGKDSMSVAYYEEALKFLPGDINQHLFLAGAYENAGRMRDAIGVYEKINSIDDTYSEAWAGMGKMYFWLGKPVTSARNYKKALVLDPENEEIMQGYRKVRQESAWGLTLRTSPIQEKEENYTINALTTRLKVEKRVSDHFRLEGNFLLDYSNRVFTGEAGDTTRWYNSSWIKADYLTKHHTISVNGGYSNTDNKMSTYGASWKLNYSPSKFSLKNTLEAGYDYYYYWNRVGAKSVSDEASVGYRFMELSGRYSYGQVDAVYTYDQASTDTGEIRENPYQSYGLSLIFRILKRPDIKVGLNHSYLDYTYKSPLYYSPDKRRLTGASASIYYTIRNFYIYGSFSYKIGNEYSYGEKMKVDNWSTLLEIGYEYDPLSFSLGGSNFYNPYYQNITGFAAIKVLF